MDNNINTNNNQNKHSNIHMVVPYTEGLSKSVKNIYGKIGIQGHFKGGNYIKSLLMVPKKRGTIT